MSMYSLPEFKMEKLKSPEAGKLLGSGRKRNIGILLLVIFFAGLLTGFVFNYYFYQKIRNDLSSYGIPMIVKENTTEKEYIPQTSQEQKVIQVVKEASPSVVSITIIKEVSVYDQDFFNFFFLGQPLPQTKEKQVVGAGTGFIVSEDGLVLTNKHVASDKTAEYKIVFSDGSEYSAKILAQDPAQDIAVMKIESDKKFVPLVLGDSSSIEIGQSVIAIGNALGEFQNTVSVGIVSGLSRTITAYGGTSAETLEDIIQTDAAISPGNSGGPLLNLAGEVIGINTAIAESGENIGFAISINKAKKDIDQVKASGKISYPFIGIRYVLLNETAAKQYSLKVSEGAYIIRGQNNEPAITSGSPAEKYGLKEKDIILEVNNEKITTDNSLSKIVAKYSPGDTISLKILRGSEEISKTIVLGEWK